MIDRNIELINAVKANDLIGLKKSIEKGADVNYVDKFKTSGLMYAIMEGTYEIAEYLLSKKADVNFIYGRDKVNLLHVAIEYKGRFYESDNIIQLLIVNGINVNFQDKYGNVPLHVACSTYGHNSDVIKSLIKNGANMEIENNYGISPYSMSVVNDAKELKSLLDSLK